MKTNISQPKKNGINTANFIFSAFAGAGFWTSCTPKTPAVAGQKVITVEYLAQGKTIFDNSCGKCHDLPEPTDFSAQDWVGIMNSMAPKSRLNEEQHQMVYDYIVSVKK